MKQKKETKFVNLKMEFNPGTQKYEPILPLKKVKNKIEVDWKFIITLIIAIIILLGILLITLKNYLP